jgi:hypothetical protein
MQAYLRLTLRRRLSLISRCAPEAPVARHVTSNVDPFSVMMRSWLRLVVQTLYFQASAAQLSLHPSI